MSAIGILRQLSGGRAAWRSLLFLKLHFPPQAIACKRFIAVRKVRPQTLQRRIHCEFYVHDFVELLWVGDINVC